MHPALQMQVEMLLFQIHKGVEIISLKTSTDSTNAQEIITIAQAVAITDTPSPLHTHTRT